MSNILPATPPRAGFGGDGGGLFSSSPSMARSVPELLSTPSNHALAVKPLNPFADDAVSNHLLIRRPGSSPQPSTHLQPNSELPRRAAITVDAVIKTTSTTAAASNAAKQRRLDSSHWLSSLTRKHPVKMLNYVRLFLALPLLGYLAAAAVRGGDWRHNEYRFDSNGSSRTQLSLSGVERVVKTGLEASENAAMLSELPVTYTSVLGSGQCDMESHVLKANSVLGADSPLDVARVNSDRSYRLAVFGILYGPTYRDVDCRALLKFRAVGLAVKIIWYFALLLVLAEWLICLIHFSSKQLMEEAAAAYEFASPTVTLFSRDSAAVTAPTAPPPFVLPSEEWVPIDMRGTTGRFAASRRQEARAAYPVEVPVTVMGSGWEWVNRFWWLPLQKLVRSCRLNVQPGDLRFYPLLSLLEGPGVLLSGVSLLLMVVGLFVWSHQTDQPACLNAETELETCQHGGSYRLAVFVTTCCGLHVLSHVVSGPINRKLEGVKLLSPRPPAPPLNKAPSGW